MTPRRVQGLGDITEDERIARLRDHLNAGIEVFGVGLSYAAVAGVLFGLAVELVNEAKEEAKKDGG